MLQAMTTKIFVKMILAAMIVVTGCQTIELSPSVTDIDNCTSSLSASTKVTPTHLAAYINGYKGIPKTRSVDVSIDPILNGTDTVMYLVNYPEGGWEVLSADTRAPIILAMSCDGNMTIEGLYSNQAEEDMFASLMDGLSVLRSNPDVQITTATNTWNDFIYDVDVASVNELESWVLISTDIVDSYVQEKQNHLTQTKWGQGTMYTTSPTWNISAPYTDSSKTYHCYTGCVPTAAAQILYYMNSKISTPYNSYTSCSVSTYIKPNNTSVEISPYEITLNGANPYVWDAMPLESASSVTPTQYKYVSALMVYLGHLYHAKYKLSGTSASTSDTPEVFASNFDLSSTWSGYNMSVVYNQIITQKLPVLMSISYYIDETRIGHAVIADGCMTKVNTVEKTYVWNSLTQGPQYKTETSYEYESFVAINWGWDGSGMYSGTEPIWYNTDVINWTVGSHTFTSVDGMVYGFAKIS